MFGTMIKKDDSNRNVTASSTNIASYTSATNMFTAPSDGYVIATINTGSGSAAVRMQNGVALLSVPLNSSGYQGYSIFVPKGMKVYIENVSKFAVCVFYPLSEY